MFFLLLCEQSSDKIGWAQIISESYEISTSSSIWERAFVILEVGCVIHLRYIGSRNLGRRLRATTIISVYIWPIKNDRTLGSLLRVVSRN